MFEIGKRASLEVLREVPMGLILGTHEREVLLPKRYVPEGARPATRGSRFGTSPLLRPSPQPCG